MTGDTINIELEMSNIDKENLVTLLKENANQIATIKEEPKKKKVLSEGDSDDEEISEEEDDNGDIVRSDDIIIFDDEFDDTYAELPEGYVMTEDVILEEPETETKIQEDEWGF